jgi:hypothetical protein
MIGKVKCVWASCALLAVSSAAFAKDKDWSDKDANNDGKISRAEFITSAEETFSKADTNNDSTLSKEEIGKYSENMDYKHKDKSG